MKDSVKNSDTAAKVRKDKTFEIHLNFTCDQKCFMCFNSDAFRKNRDSLDFEKVSRALFRMRKLGYGAVSLVGGEPTLHPEIKSIIAFARKCGYRKTVVLSNGRRFSDESFTAGLKKAGLDSVCVSVHSHHPELHDEVTGVTGSFQKAEAGLKNLVKFKMNPMITLVLNKKNCKEVPEFMNYFLRLGVRKFQISFLKYQGRLLEKPEQAKKFLVSMTEALSGIDGIFEFAGKHGLRPPTIAHVPACMAPGYVNRLDSYRPSEAKMMLQDGCDYDLSKAYSGWKFKKTCLHCIYFKGCTGFDPEYAKIFGEKEFKPVLKKPTNKK